MALAVFATVGGAMVATDPAFAKTDVDKLTIGGEIRERYEVRTNTYMNQGNPLASKGNESQGSSRVRVSVGYDLTPDVSFFAQIQDARQFGSEGVNAVGTTGIQAVSQTNANQTGVDLHQGYIQVKNVLVPGLSLKAGRQEIIYGDHRLFGNFGWSQVGNSFDAVKLSHSTQMVDVDLFWARIFDNAATTTQAGNNNVPFPLATNNSGTVGATTATNNQDIYGAYVTLKVAKTWTIEPYFFLLQDSRPSSLGQTNNAGATTMFQAQTQAQTRNFLGGRVNGKQGGLDFTYEGNYQFGSMQDNCSRTAGAACGTLAGQAGIAGQVTGSRGAHINASQHAVRTGYTFEAVPMKPRLGFEFDYASGDKCANGPGAGDKNQCGGNDRSFSTADNLYPTNHFHYGYMDLMAWRNMVNYQIKFDVKPSPVSKLQFDYNIMRLANTADNWYRGGQAAYFASKPTNQAASLGQELDVHYWHTFKEKFKFEIGVGHFFAGEYLQKSVGAQSVTNAATQGSAGNGLTSAANTSTVDQNWGYVMGSILF
jgi:hypothetical protein